MYGGEVFRRKQVCECRTDAPRAQAAWPTVDEIAGF